MKKYFLVLILLVAPIFSFAQSINDMAYSNADFMTYFQQEMTSLTRFKFENDTHIPFFAGISYHNSSLSYDDKYLDWLYSDWPNGHYFRSGDKGAKDVNTLFGWQIKANKTFSIPIIFSGSFTRYKSYVYYDYNFLGRRFPLYADSNRGNGFLASGLLYNTNILKGGVYIGGDIKIHATELDDNADSHADIKPHSNMNDDFFFSSVTTGLKVTLVQLIDTSSFSYIGKALNNVLVYLGTGDPVLYATNKVFDEGYTKFGSFVNTLNAALEFRFNEIHLNPLSLQVAAKYSRGNYDAVSKNDIYGLKIDGMLNRFPVGFSLEGGYKHLFYVSQWFEEDYPNTAYFTGSIYYPFDNVSIGLMYGYDNIYKSKISFAVSANFASGFFTYNPVDQYANKERFSNGNGVDLGIRYRHGGWREAK